VKDGSRSKTWSAPRATQRFLCMFLCWALATVLTLEKIVKSNAIDEDDANKPDNGTVNVNL
jgi:hypothetical protein